MAEKEEMAGKEGMAGKEAISTEAFIASLKARIYELEKMEKRCLKIKEVFSEDLKKKDEEIGVARIHAAKLKSSLLICNIRLQTKQDECEQFKENANT